MQVVKAARGVNSGRHSVWERMAREGGGRDEMICGDTISPRAGGCEHRWFHERGGGGVVAKVRLLAACWRVQP